MRRGIVISVAVFVILAGLTCAPRDETPPKGDNVVVENPGKGAEVVNVNADDLKGQIESALKQIKQRKLEPNDGFWTIFHAILGMGFDTELTLTDNGGE